MIGIFKENEERYLNWHNVNQNGYVFNHFKGKDAAYNKIHVAACRTLWREKDKGARTKVEKICSDNLHELVKITEEMRQTKGYSYCKICMPEYIVKSEKLPKYSWL